MRIDLHIGMDQCGAERLQSVLADKRELLAQQGILYSSTLGNRNHTRLFMAVTDPDHIDPLRYNRGFISAAKQSALYDAVLKDLKTEVSQQPYDRLILSCSQLCWLRSDQELARLKTLLTAISQDIRIIAHVDEPAQVLTRVYAEQINEGRAQPLSQEITLAKSGNWWQGALDQLTTIDAQAGLFAESQSSPHWLDYPAATRFWGTAFGPQNIHLRTYDPKIFNGADITDEICQTFEVKGGIGKTAVVKPLPPIAAAALTRGRQLNALLLQVLSSRKRILPRQLWRSFVQDVTVDGPPLDPGSLHEVSAHFATRNRDLVAAQDGLSSALVTPPAKTDNWREADPLFGYRASQYLLGYMWRINKATREERRAKRQDLETLHPPAETAPDNQDPPKADGLTETASALMPPLAVQNFEKLRGSPFAPHNRMGKTDEQAATPAYTTVPKRSLPKGSSGNVIVACMKNEAPYIVEWIAYHRAIGVDTFLIYTNDCSDGTTEILDRLDAMGVIHHRSNENWTGNSPQQAALNDALTEKVVKQADWLIHIDVDEFMNIRTGNGTLEDFFKAVPEATNVAMTWRLFGHNDVTRLQAGFVIDQFDHCAPAFCPKPHTVWGFKTMFRNINAYEKMSCHRPNKLRKSHEKKVKWVNGSGRDMTKEAIKNGWRSSKKSVGYDLLQLNHYALRSAESYLIKRQRGRALHVDRSIGINYWIRMDWSDHKDVSIQRNLPRLQAEYDALMQDNHLRSWHEHGLDWHFAKAEELHENPEFEDLYKQALTLKLTATERVAFALALDTES